MNWSTYRRESQNKQKKDQILSYMFLPSFFYKKTYLDPCLWFILFWESHKPTELVQTLTHRMGYSRKKTNSEGGEWSEDILFWKNPWNFWVSYFMDGNSRQNKASSLETPQNFVTPLGNFKAKPRLLEITHDFFLITPGNSTLFLINPWKYPWKFHFLE